MPESAPTSVLAGRRMRQDRFMMAAYGVLFAFLAIQLVLMLWLDLRG
ncbi:MAG TPA: hypothetical protein VHC95_04240 [Opitutales bacterium]|nr:hypothetical protein [Opitutales bacterium]